MSSDSIESMVQHLVEEKPREQVITEVMSLANELVAMEQEVAAAVLPEEKDPPQPNIRESAFEQEPEKPSTDEEKIGENQVADEETVDAPVSEGEFCFLFPLKVFKIKKD